MTFKRAFGLLVMALILVMGLVVPVGAQDGGGDEPTPDPLGGATEFAQADAQTSVDLLLDWTPNTNHLGFYAAQELGYYADANLDVTIQQPTDLMVESVVVSGAADFGVSYQEVASFALADGSPIVSLAAIIQHNTSGFTTLHEQDPLTGPADMAGLRYGGFGQPDLELAMLDTLLACAGAEPGSIEYIDVGYTDMFQLMERDRIDLAWIYYGWTGIEAELRGYDLDIVMLEDHLDCVPDYYTPILITSQTMIDEQPDVVAAFVQATARGYAYAIENPEEAAQILIDAVPELDPDLVQASAEWLAPRYQSDAPRWGQQSGEVWERFSQFLVDNDILGAMLDTEAAFTNEFLPGDIEPSDSGA